jgi:hypothetical protein
MDTSPGDQPESDPAEQVVHEAATRFLDLQISTDDTLDRQNAAVIGVGSTILLSQFPPIGWRSHLVK